MNECDELAAEGGPQRLELRPGVYKRLFKNKAFRRLWMSGFVSGVGDWLVIGLLIKFQGCVFMNFVDIMLIEPIREFSFYLPYLPW